MVRVVVPVEVVVTGGGVMVAVTVVVAVVVTVPVAKTFVCENWVFVAVTVDVLG